MKFIFIYLINYYLVSAYLTSSQWFKINKLLNGNTPIEIKNKLKYIIFNKYKNKTISDALLFKKKYLYSFKDIKNDEIKLYAYTGLLKAINMYKSNISYGYSNFYNFSQIYIKSELYKCIADRDCNILPYYYRKKNIKNKYKIQFLGNDEWIIDKYNPKQINYINIDHVFKIINTLDPSIKRTFYLKYNNNLDSIRSVKQVSELMCWSPEITRQKLKLASTIIRYKLSN